VVNIFIAIDIECISQTVIRKYIFLRQVLKPLHITENIAKSHEIKYSDNLDGKYTDSLSCNACNSTKCKDVGCEIISRNYYINTYDY
jgi:hypothetical protein